MTVKMVTDLSGKGNNTNGSPQKNQHSVNVNNYIIVIAENILSNLYYSHNAAVVDFPSFIIGIST